MCGLCGALGSSQYWTDAAGRPEFEQAGKKVTRRDERQRRVALIAQVTKPCGVRIFDWGGNSYILENEEGKRANVYNLAGIWSVVDELTRVELDPLDPEYLAHLERLSA